MYLKDIVEVLYISHSETINPPSLSWISFSLEGRLATSVLTVEEAASIEACHSILARWLAFGSEAYL